MSYFKPTKYYKNIYSIDYNKLKKLGIKCLVFDLDNTLGLIINKSCPKESIDLVKKLKKDFIVVVCTNNTRRRLSPYLAELDIEGYPWSFKPTSFGLRKIKKKYSLEKEEICIIGDQLLTDVFSGKNYNIMTILVDPMGKKDLKVTKINRIIENIILKKYNKKGIFKRGNYYE